MSAAEKLAPRGVAQVFEFEGSPLHVYLFRGRPCWIAQDVGAALGYTREGFNAALRDWSDELFDGKDAQTLRGQDLREFKAVTALEVDSTSSRAGSLTILYESGVDLVCLKTEKPLGKTLRRFMADKVMPGLRRGSLDTGRANAELVALSLRLTAGDAASIWERETVQEICRLYHQPIWDGIGRMPPWLKEPMGRIYRIVLGDVVYAELKARNPNPRDGSLNYQFLTEARHRLMQNDMGTVSALVRLSRSREEFVEKLRFACRRTTTLQLAW